MCGITGFAEGGTQGASSGELHATVSRMSGTLVYRGPDDAGSWVDEQAGVALGFRR